MKYAIAAAAVVGLVSALPAADNEWETWTTTTTTTASSEWETWTTTTTTPAAEWTTWKAPEPTCYTVSTWEDKNCDGGKDQWGNCNAVTKTTTIYDDKYCSTWEAVTIKTPEAATTWATWKPEETCYTASVYTTKECGSDSSKWDNCKDVTKTSTVYGDEYCTSTTWAAATIKTPEAVTTWAPATIKTPEAATTWATWSSSTVSAPVAKWTGAADKQAVGMGAIAVAALAAFL